MLITFACNNQECENHIEKFFKSHKDVPAFLNCGACGIGKLERQIGAPTSKSTQFVDNGGLTKSVELLNELVDDEYQRRIGEE